MSISFYEDSVLFSNLFVSVKNLPLSSGVDVVIVHNGGKGVIADSRIPNVSEVNWRLYAPGEYQGSYPLLYSGDEVTNDYNIPVSVASIISEWQPTANIMYIDRSKMMDTTLGFDKDMSSEAIKNWHNSKSDGTPTIVLFTYIHDNFTYVAKGYANNYDVVGPQPVRYDISASQSGPYGLNYRNNQVNLASVSGNIINFLNSHGLPVNVVAQYSSEDRESDAYSNGANDSLISAFPDSTLSQSAIDGYDSLVSVSGIICISPAGDSGRKMVKLGHPDYNNNLTHNVTGADKQSNVYFYNRLCFPAAVGMITVGAMDSDYQRKKLNTSNCGEAIDCYAPGGMTQTWIGNKYVPRAGTVIAAANVAGLLACYLSDENNRSSFNMTTDGAKAWIIANGTAKMYPYYTEDDGNPYSLQATASSNVVATYPSGDIEVAVNQTNSLRLIRPRPVVECKAGELNSLLSSNHSAPNERTMHPVGHHTRFSEIQDPALGSTLYYRPRQQSLKFIASPRGLSDTAEPNEVSIIGGLTLNSNDVHAFEEIQSYLRFNLDRKRVRTDVGIFYDCNNASSPLSGNHVIAFVRKHPEDDGGWQAVLEGYSGGSEIFSKKLYLNEDHFDAYGSVYMAFQRYKNNGKLYYRLYVYNNVAKRLLPLLEQTDINPSLFNHSSKTGILCRHNGDSNEDFSSLPGEYDQTVVNNIISYDIQVKN